MSEAVGNTGGGGTGGDSGGGASGNIVGSGGAAAQGSTSTSGSTSSSDWTSSLNDDFKGYVQTKGFKDPGQVLDSYRNLEKLMGAPKERLLKLPEKADDPAWNEIYGKLGRPEKADEYKVDGWDDESAKWAKDNFHKLGLSRTQAEKLVASWNERTEAQKQASLDAHQAKIAADDKQLKTEWGQAYDQNTQLARRAVKEFGMDAATIDKLESVLGFAGVMKHMYTIGAKLGESPYVASNSNGASNFNRFLTPEAAKSRINTLRADSDFTRRYINNEAAAKYEMEQLHKMAYGE